MADADAAQVADVSADEMTAAEPAAAEAAYVAGKASAGEMSPAAVESGSPDGSRGQNGGGSGSPPTKTETTKPVAIVVTRIGAAVTIVVAGAIIRPIGVVAAVRIAGRDAADQSGRDGRAGIVAIAVNVAVSVSPNVVVMA